MTPARPRSSRLWEDRGSVTAETAIVLPVILMLVLVLAVAGLGLSTQVRLEGAARAAAREMARGEPVGSARDAARTTAGKDVSVTVRREGDWVHVETSRALRAPAGPLRAESWTLHAEASARLEPQLLQDPP